MDRVRASGFEESFLFTVLLPYNNGSTNSGVSKQREELDRGANPLYAYVLSGIVAFY